MRHAWQLVIITMVWVLVLGVLAKAAGPVLEQFSEAPQATRMEEGPEIRGEAPSTHPFDE